MNENVVVAFVPRSEDLRQIAADLSYIYADLGKAGSDWVKASLAMMEKMRQGRDRFADHNDFSKWLIENNVKFYSKDVQAALLAMSTNIELARTLLNQAVEKNCYSWLQIWRQNKEAFRPESKRGPRKPKETRQPTNAQVHRMLKLGDEQYEQLKATSLKSSKELDALIELKERTPDMADDLIKRAIAGEAVSAVAIQETKKRNPEPTGEELITSWTRTGKHLSMWLRASDETQEKLIAYMREHRRHA